MDLPQPKKWSIVPFESRQIQFHERQMSLGLTTRVVTDGRTTHDLILIDDIFYNIPREGDCNILLSVLDTDKVIPLAADSLTGEGNIATVKMIQKVKACKKNEPVGDEIKMTTYPEVQHPYRELLYGEKKIPWQVQLLEASEKTAKASGYSEIRIVSGFTNPHLSDGILLPLGIQQYDLIIDKIEQYQPQDENGVVIEGEDRRTLNIIMRKLREKKELKNLEDVKKIYPKARLPKYWVKKLK